jgi:hypothetical protein
MYLKFRKLDGFGRQSIRAASRALENGVAVGLHVYPSLPDEFDISFR